VIQNKWNPVLNIPEGTSGNCELRHFKQHGPVKAFNMRVALFGQPCQTIPFEGETTWHEILEDGGRWMSDLPIEQQQHDRELERMSDSHRVLVGGLGLGYAIHKMVLDYDVSEVHVVEINPDVIKLVWTHVHPEVKERCTIHLNDLFQFLKHVEPEEYDWGFFDIWRGDGEGVFHETVVPLRRLARGKCDCVVNWNEDVMRGQLMQQLTSRHSFMNMPAEHRKLIGLDDADEQREYLTKYAADSIYHKWAIPFWNAYYDDKIHADRFQQAARDYVSTYEVFDRWLEAWDFSVCADRYAQAGEAV